MREHCKCILKTIKPSIANFCSIWFLLCDLPELVFRFCKLDAVLSLLLPLVSLFFLLSSLLFALSKNLGRILRSFVRNLNLRRKLLTRSILCCWGISLLLLCSPVWETFHMLWASPKAREGWTVFFCCRSSRDREVRQHLQNFWTKFIRKLWKDLWRDACKNLFRLNLFRWQIQNPYLSIFY